MGVWSKRRSTRYLWSSLVIATIVACGVLLFISLHTGTKKVLSSLQESKDYSASADKLTEEKCISVCDTKECVYESKILLGYLKPAVNACENFHQFTCGNIFERRNLEETFDYTMHYREKMNVKLKSVLDSIAADPESASGKMRIVYDSCMKHSSSDFQAIPTILQFLRNIGIPEWPNLSQDFQFVDPSLTTVIANLLVHGEYGFVKFETKYSFMDLENSDLKVNSSVEDIMCAYEKLFKTSQRKYLVNRILNYFNLEPEIIEEMWEELEAVRVAISNLKEENMKLYNEDKIPFYVLLECTSDPPREWKHLCEILESFIQIAEANDKVSKDFASVQSSVYYMQNIFHVLSNFSERSVANYLALNVVLNNIDQLNFYFRLTWKKANEGIDEYYDPIMKWKKCIKWISEHMALVLGHEYIKKDFTLPMVEEVQSLAEECVRETADVMLRQEWMADNLRIQLKERVGNFSVSLGKIIELMANETAVSWFYDEFYPSEKNFLYNTLEYRKFFNVMETRGLFSFEDTDWLKRMFLPDAGGGGGGIDIQLGLLLPPTYSPGLQRAMNLVSLGVVILHETGHNVQMLLKYRLKSDPKAKDYYEEKLNCLEEQYSKFTFESLGKNLNGSQYLKENFADIVAVAIVDKIIEKYSSEDFSFLLPSISLTMKQQLYIRSMQMWCSVHTKKDDETFYYFDSHSPDRFRMLGMMQNSKGFSEAFGCGDGSYMNPTNKCALFE